MNSHVYLFLNADNARYNEISKKSDIAYPQPISNDWPDLPIEFQRHIDDVINLNGYLYFFKGSQYAKFDIAKAKVIDGPKFIADGWPGLKGTEFENGIDAATEFTTNIVCFFKGSDCIDYAVNSHTIKRKSISDRWEITKKHTEFSKNLDAVTWRINSAIALFKDNHYIAFNPQSNTIVIGPAPVTNYTNGAFKTAQAAVLIDTDLLGSDRGNNGGCSGTCGTNDTGKHCFQLPQSIRFGLIAYTNTTTHKQTVNVYIDDLLVDTFTGKGTDTKAYTSGAGNVCIEIIGDGKPCKLRYSYNTLDGKPGTVTIGAENDANNNYNDSVVVLNWPLT
ncbi:photopexin B [Photorhabdus laumondii subsp. laumondii]|uniref:Photopexin B n=1 Tax=Photorhabdus laumondii subsp. laumondii TaxID=141679 RepID=A0A6L9JRJ2_PHOLM|nr:fucose-binding lectin II [Photorhabdus laumondii]MCC8386413.1 photopexin B [Photorhabdus laumondii]MCC8414366.1 photopexin B [Photorhabdus laumondii]NDK97015.1 photopexin B [Photorhabdus laumondii subsp. laumondii]NDL23166.1 photopexin B [Photorhabdus laumondii subsp. laumondii]NDL32209.1 photopexin B [Photorhabdus laumondii subsp. laumondii]